LLAGFVESGALPFWALAFPLTFMGLSQGMTISPNQTLTLNSVDPRYGGVAGGILQLGQRTGSAVGTAMIPGIIFSLTVGGTAWLEAFTIALVIIMALTLAALGVSIADRARAQSAPASLSAAPPEGAPRRGPPGGQGPSQRRSELLGHRIGAVFVGVRRGHGLGLELGFRLVGRGGAMLRIPPDEQADRNGDHPQ